MKIATYNFCQGGTDDFNAPYRVLEALQPDILLGQELCPSDMYLQKSQKNWSDLGYRIAVWETVPTHRKWGSAIFIKAGTVEQIAIPDALHGWVVGIKLSPPNPIDQGDAPLTLFSVHVPTKKENNYYIWQVQDVLTFIETQSKGTSMVVGGDFNVTISVRNSAEKPAITPLEQEIIEYMRRSVGLINCWQTVHPNTTLPRTFHSKETSNGHIDGIFVSPDLSPYLQSCWIIGSEKDQWSDGDHYPVVADFSLIKPIFRPQVARSPVSASQ